MRKRIRPHATCQIPILLASRAVNPNVFATGEEEGNRNDPLVGVPAHCDSDDPPDAVLPLCLLHQLNHPWHEQLLQLLPLLVSDDIAQAAPGHVYKLTE